MTQPRKKQQAEAPEAATSPKAFLAVKRQTIYAMISKQGVKVPVRRQTGRMSTNYICFHAIPRSPGPGPRTHSLAVRAPRSVTSAASAAGGAK